MRNSIFVLLLSTSSAYGQVYHPLIRPNTFWDVHHGDIAQICHVSGGYQYFFEGDTLIMGVEYAIVRAHPIVSLLPVPYCPPYAIDSTISSIAAFSGTQAHAVIPSSTSGAASPLRDSMRKK